MGSDLQSYVETYTHYCVIKLYSLEIRELQEKIITSYVIKTMTKLAKNTSSSRTNHIHIHS